MDDSKAWSNIATSSISPVTSYSGVNYNFTGLIDEVAIFDHALESSIIGTTYSGSLPIGTSQSLDLNTLPTSPTSWYRMGD